MKLIVGLGNPGREYAHNRHNIGFMCLNHLAKVHGIKLDKKQGQARTGSGDIAGEKGVKELTFPPEGNSLRRIGYTSHSYYLAIDADRVFLCWSGITPKSNHLRAT